MSRRVESLATGRQLERLITCGEKGALGTLLLGDDAELDIRLFSGPDRENPEGPHTVYLLAVRVRSVAVLMIVRRPPTRARSLVPKSPASLTGTNTSDSLSAPEQLGKSSNQHLITPSAPSSVNCSGSHHLPRYRALPVLLGTASSTFEKIQSQPHLENNEGMVVVRGKKRDCILHA